MTQFDTVTNIPPNIVEDYQFDLQTFVEKSQNHPLMPIAGP